MPSHPADRDPEDPHGAPRVQMTTDQLRFIQLWAADRSAVGVSIEERGHGYLEVVAWDKTNVDVGRRTVLPSGNALPQAN